MQKTLRTMKTLSCLIAVIVGVSLQSCGESQDDPSRAAFDAKLAESCEIKGGETEIDGVLHWGPPGHHGESKWLDGVEDHSSVTPENFIMMSNNDDSYAVTFSEDFKNYMKERGYEPFTDGLVFVGSWKGLAGTTDPGCSRFHGLAELFENRAMEIQSARNLRVLE